jgi:zinc protease
VPLPAVAITWQGPAASDPDAAALVVLDAILSGGKSSRLYNSLVYDQQLAQAAFSSADLNAQPGLFWVGAIMGGGKTVEEGQAALMAEIKRLRDAPPTEAELAEARTEMIASAVRDRETIDGRAFSLGYALIMEGDAAKANTGIAELQAVTAADVQRVAQQIPRRRPSGDHPLSRRRPAASRRGRARRARVKTRVKSPKFKGQVFSLAPKPNARRPRRSERPSRRSCRSPSEKILANGLRVIVARSSDLPLVTAELTVQLRRGGRPVRPRRRLGHDGRTADRGHDHPQFRRHLQPRPRRSARTCRPARAGSRRR